MTVILVPWALYVNFHPRFDNMSTGAAPIKEDPHGLGQLKVTEIQTTDSRPRTSPVDTKPTKIIPTGSGSKKTQPKWEIPTLPVLGPVVTNGAQPLYDIKHKGTDAIFALACNYPKLYYQRFVGSLRKVGYTEDIVLAVSPEEKMKPGVLMLFS
jgi:hypothetical protein